MPIEETVFTSNKLDEIDNSPDTLLGIQEDANYASLENQS